MVDIFEKKNLTERDICTKYITPAIVETAGWNRDTQLKEELSLTKGKVIVRGKLHRRGEQKRADYVLYYKTNIPLAVVEAKDNTHTMHSGIQQAIEYANLRMNNIEGGKVLLSNLKYVSPRTKDLPRLYLKTDELLFNRTNSYQLVGKTGIFKGQSDKFTFASYLIRTTLFNSFICADYVNLAMNAD